MISQGSQLIVQDLFQTIYLSCSCFKLFLKKSFPPNVYPQCQLLLSSSLVDTVLTSSNFYCLHFSLHVPFLCFFIYNLIPVNDSDFIWCWFFSFLVGVMCLICLFHLLNTYRLSFLKLLKDKIVKFWRQGSQFSLVSSSAFTGLGQFT